MNLDARAQDGARAKKPDSGHDLRCDSGRVRGSAELLQPEAGEEARSDADEGHGSNAGGVAVVLPLESYRHREDGGYEET